MRNECLRDGVNAWRQMRQLAAWHVIHQAPSGLATELMHHVCDVRLRNLPAPVRCMFKHHTCI